MSDKVYRAAAIGRTGGGNYGHGLHLAYKGLDNVEFIAVADPDEAGREKAKADTGALRAYADYHEVLAQEDLDIVSVCPRWVDCHLEMVLACIEAGCHVYCEKTMSISLEDGDTMVTAAEDAGLKLAVAHQGVYLPGVQKIKSMLGEGKIGQVQAIYAHGKQDNKAHATLKFSKATLNDIQLKEATIEEKIQSGELKISGDKKKFDEFLSLLDNFSFWFNIVTP